MRRLIILPLFLLCACAAGAGQAGAPERSAGFTIAGRVVRVTVEGGFYGLVAEDGRRFDAGVLPAPFQIDGLAIRARLQDQPPMVGTRMWGTQVRLLEIERR